MKLEFLAPYCIVGSGKTGTALATLLKHQGVADHNICIFEDTPKNPLPGIQSFSDSHKVLADFKPKTLLVSPGYPLSRDWLQKAEASGVLLSSELEYVLSLLEGEKIIAVSGSLGKSTTVSLLGEAVSCADENAFVGGNLGIPLASYASEVKSGKRKRAQYMVLELSSYQLERCRNLKATAAILTYFSPNHLDRYASLEDYYRTKWLLAENCLGPVVLNSRSADLVNYAEKQKASQVLLVNADSGPLSTEQLKTARLIGKHQWDNLSCAAALVKALQWPWDCVWEKLKNFTGLSHRLELLGSARDVFFVNDSKATTIESVLSAVDSLESLFSGTDHKLWLFLGGKDKNLPWTRLSVLKNKSHLKIGTFGECRKLVNEGLGTLTPTHPTLREALLSIVDQVKPGDYVLLSPGGTSLDEFKSFEDRGEKFKLWVEEMFGVLK